MQKAVVHVIHCALRLCCELIKQQMPLTTTIMAAVVPNLWCPSLASVVEEKMFVNVAALSHCYYLDGACRICFVGQIVSTPTN